MKWLKWLSVWLDLLASDEPVPLDFNTLENITHTEQADAVPRGIE